MAITEEEQNMKRVVRNLLKSVSLLEEAIRDEDGTDMLDRYDWMEIGKAKKRATKYLKEGE